jgi:hypothetical protein
MLNESREARETRPHETMSDDPPPSADISEKLHEALYARAEAEVRQPARHHPPATELLETPGALLTRTHLRELGLERRAVDAVFRALPVVALPGYSRPMIRAEEYRELVERSTYCDDRVRPMARAS